MKIHKANRYLVALTRHYVLTVYYSAGQIQDLSRQIFRSSQHYFGFNHTDLELHRHRLGAAVELSVHL